MRKKLDAIKMLVLDVDGVLTDGTILVDSRGRESKSFSIIDGHGIKMWKRAGLKIAFLSGRASATTKHQAVELAVDFCLNGRRDKLKGLKELIKMSEIPAGQIAYVGDDLPDLPVIRCVGFAAAVANAVDEIKQAADYVTKQKGGEGAVREIIEYILKKTGRWNAIVKKYAAGIAQTRHRPHKKIISEKEQKIKCCCIREGSQSGSFHSWRYWSSILFTIA